MESEDIPHKLNVRDELQSLSVEEILAISKLNTNPAAVCCLNLKGDNNLGMIIRTASNFSMSKVYLLGRRLYDRRTAVGMQNYIPVERILATIGDHSEALDVEAILGFLKEMSTKHQIVFVEQGGENLRNLNAALSKSAAPPLFIMGAEDTGIPKKILEFQPSICVSIPQTGVGRSFNVNTAFSMVVWEYFRETVL